MPIAFPRFASSKEALMMARLPGTSNAPPMPCAARATIRSLTLCARPQPIDASAKTATPAQKMRRAAEPIA